MVLSSQAETRNIYLKRPDLGRCLSDASKLELAEEG
ncbi:MAG: ethanolamine ammonia-lyase light chain EutC, partial [Candidatus Pacearchaeota archaeon]|nr:ethanolamine ammonia-lyase light chain EutC [Candidatus Pacearchaeota archaeon]